MMQSDNHTNVAINGFDGSSSAYRRLAGQIIDSGCNFKLPPSAMTGTLCYVTPSGPAAQVYKHRYAALAAKLWIATSARAGVLAAFLSYAGHFGTYRTYFYQEQNLRIQLYLDVAQRKLKVLSMRHTSCRSHSQSSLVFMSNGGWLTISHMAYAGRVQDQHSDVRCCSSQDQEASVQQKGPDISRLDPALQEQWDHAANAHLGAIDIKPKSGRKVWWICDQCPDGHLHRWEAAVYSRSNGRGCPQCSGHKVCKHNSLATKAPKVAAQWDYGANIGTPDSVVAQSNKSVGWLCEVCGEQWSQPPSYRVSKRKTGCPQCARKAQGKKKLKHPTFAECQDPHSKAVLAEWDHERNALKRNFPHNTSLRSAKQIFWLCNKCPAGQQHSWSAAPYNRTGKMNSGCPFCAGKAA